MTSPLWVNSSSRDGGDLDVGAGVMRTAQLSTAPRSTSLHMTDVTRRF